MLINVVTDEFYSSIIIYLVLIHNYLDTCMSLFPPVILPLSLQLHSSSCVAQPDSKLPELPVPSPALTSSLPQHSQCPQLSQGGFERPGWRSGGPQGDRQHRLVLIVVWERRPGAQPAGGREGPRESEPRGRRGPPSTAPWEEKRGWGGRRAWILLPLSERVFQPSQRQQSQHPILVPHDPRPPQRTQWGPVAWSRYTVPDSSGMRFIFLCLSVALIHLFYSISLW